MEFWDIYDINRIKTGKTMKRGESIADANYHLVVHICIFNAKGEMLIQQRQPFKESWPDLWDLTVGGSAVAGDSSQLAAERELYEEIGLEIDFNGIRPHFTINFDVGYDDFYLFETDVDITKLKLQHEEVQTVKWASKDEIFTMIDSGKFIRYHKSLISMCFDMRKKYGAHAEG